MSDIPETGSEPTEEEPTEEELAAQFAEQLAKTPVRDIMLQSLATLIDAAGIRIGYGPVGESPIADPWTETSHDCQPFAHGAAGGTFCSC